VALTGGLPPPLTRGTLFPAAWTFLPSHPLTTRLSRFLLRLVERYDGVIVFLPKATVLYHKFRLKSSL